MSENSDILEFIAQCLLNHKVDNTTKKGSNRSSNYIMNATKTDILKRNIQDAIYDRIFQDDLDISYKIFEIENSQDVFEF
mgnify:CR=1 FL=1